MTAIGSISQLPILRFAPNGAYLDGEQLGEILLPKRYLEEEMKQGDKVSVFIHKDSEDRLIGTTDEPFILANECGFLRVTQVNDIGAFADIGLDKELLIPFAQQHKPLVAGRSYLVFCFLNKHDQRLIGSTKIDRFLSDTALNTMQQGDKVDLIVGPKTPLGYKVVVNKRVWGLIHNQAVFEQLRSGQPLTGYIESIRGDGKVNVVLQKKSEAMPKDAEKIMRYLRANGGVAPFNDKTDPEKIKEVFQLSKGAFKRGIGYLYRNKQILIKDNQIEIVE
ncbi:MAG TPA: GntR family transcriptional regulator [Gammaproteobacteria bacterium]|nr:GntR family transcriptional regulator [Gammaproteobacteria bacterium]MEC8012537.1 S1-like domain-containing RNA-binding protein [Pseudomonadota bacterium]HBF08117.1 GntR family transcriptional regulator [Gammaproteobacteria bacterium]HCK93359.1 GntR family transcriptional regulator [Gammaproteobacteria bacterium]|tara:strand:- start:279 stop:1112 length:834 start_codon:yes stop_codon:yes gene_type:complete